MVRWTAENNQKLENMWLANVKDAAMAAYFNTGEYAVAKQRSNLGLVHHKMPKGIKRKARTLIEQNIKPFFAIFYRKNGVNHFSYLDTPNEQKVIELGRNLIYKQQLHDVTILQPTIQLVCETIKQIKL